MDLDPDEIRQQIEHELEGWASRAILGAGRPANPAIERCVMRNQLNEILQQQDPGLIVELLESQDQAKLRLGVSHIRQTALGL